MTQPNNSLDRSGGSVFGIKRGAAKLLGDAPPGQLLCECQGSRVGFGFFFSFISSIETIVVVVGLWETRSVFGAEFSIGPQPSPGLRVQGFFLPQPARETDCYTWPDSVDRRTLVDAALSI